MPDAISIKVTSVVTSSTTGSNSILIDQQLPDDTAPTRQERFCLQFDTARSAHKLIVISLDLLPIVYKTYRSIPGGSGFTLNSHLRI